MPQVKKMAVRDAILDAASRLFATQGYHGSRLSEIAADAGVSPANVYVYFKSKLDIAFAIYGPWLRRRLEALELEVAELPDPESRLRRIFEALWRDIPNEHSGFANNIMQALSTATPDEGYQPHLLQWAEGKVALMLKGALDHDARNHVDVQAIAHAMFMAFDGFAMNARLHADSGCSKRIIDTFCGLLLRTPLAPRQTPAKRRTRVRAVAR